MTPRFPIVFVHQGDSWYLWYTLRQARLSNPDADVVLISDVDNPAYRPFARHVPMSRCGESARSFAAVYRHLSTNHPGFELICLQRWFILKDFMEAEGCRRAFHQDSDVMSYADVALEGEAFKAFDVTVVAGVGPWSLYVNDPSWAGRFCSFITENYATAAGLRRLEEWYAAHRAEGRSGGICDMWFFGEWGRLHPGKVGEMSGVRDGATFDHHVSVSDGYEMAGGMKRLAWRGRHPCARRQDTGEWVRFLTLHFQGAAKRHIPRYAWDRDWTFPFRNFYRMYVARAFMKARKLLGRG